jgi:hypothetical protein
MVSPDRREVSTVLPGRDSWPIAIVPPLALALTFIVTCFLKAA